jgi:mRNA-degrading endonuclease YafQ of YafQ-DinJ toxin-antitoxin module
LIKVVVKFIKDLKKVSKKEKNILKEIRQVVYNLTVVKSMEVKE